MQFFSKKLFAILKRFSRTFISIIFLMKIFEICILMIKFLYKISLGFISYFTAKKIIAKRLKYSLYSVGKRSRFYSVFETLSMNNSVFQTCRILREFTLHTTISVCKINVKRITHKDPKIG